MIGPQKYAKFENRIRTEINKKHLFCSWNAVASRDHKTGTKTYTSIAHPRLLDQEKPVVYHFLAVSVLK